MHEPKTVSFIRSFFCHYPINVTSFHYFRVLPTTFIIMDGMKLNFPWLNVNSIMCPSILCRSLSKCCLRALCAKMTPIFLGNSNTKTALIKRFHIIHTKLFRLVYYCQFSSDTFFFDCRSSWSCISRYVTIILWE